MYARVSAAAVRSSQAVGLALRPAGLAHRVPKAFSSTEVDHNLGVDDVIPLVESSQAVVVSKTYCP